MTPTMLNEFVDKVIVHVGVRTSRGRTQKVDIYLNFIGKCDVSGQEEAESEPLAPVGRKLAQWRAYYQKRRERLSAEKEKAEEIASRAEKIHVKRDTEESVGKNQVI
jgi:hypothetical protein